ncbi:MAG TPA: hypothetical protein VMV89_03990, partial [Candidatus Paceibacterota bacterium]|nr:hypothetical protein [Candidatus Paceibacterota bacterium]
MNTVIASDGIPDIQAQAHDITRRQLQEWFVWMDRISFGRRAAGQDDQVVPQDIPVGPVLKFADH